MPKEVGHWFVNRDRGPGGFLEVTFEGNYGKSVFHIYAKSASSLGLELLERAALENEDIEKGRKLEGA